MFLIFSISDIEREELDFSSKAFRLVCQKCNLRDRKLFVENYLLSKKTFLFLFVLSASEIEQNLLAFPQTNRPGCQNSILCAHRNLFLRKKYFLDKICFFFISIWDMGQKTAFWQVCLPLLCQNFILPVHRTILKFFFPKNLQPFSRLSDSWPKKFSALVMKDLAN